jgi:hypothetical protein
LDFLHFDNVLNNFMIWTWIKYSLEKVYYGILNINTLLQNMVSIHANKMFPKSTHFIYNSKNIQFLDPSMV